MQFSILDNGGVIRRRVNCLWTVVYHHGLSLTVLNS